MWAANSPQRTVQEAAIACAESIRNADLRRRVLTAITSLAAISAAFQALGEEDKIHAVPNYPVSGLTADEMVSLYSHQFVAGQGRAIYDEIIQAAPRGRCCYCQFGIATTLDHFVPKRPYSGLAIEPWNLIPACKDCNHRLLNAFSTRPQEQMLHPYFMPDIGRWLYARVLPGEPYALQFHVQPDVSLNSFMKQRICAQAESLKLCALYSIVGSAELSDISASLPRLHKLGGAQLVKEQLEDMKNQAMKNGQNSRRAVICEALSDDYGYCDGGFYTSIG